MWIWLQQLYELELLYGLSVFIFPTRRVPNQMLILYLLITKLHLTLITMLLGLPVSVGDFAGPNKAFLMSSSLFP